MYRTVPFLFYVHPELCPSLIAVQQLRKPVFQILIVFLRLKLAHLLGFQLHIGHTDPYCRTVRLVCIDKSITARLCQMHWDRGFQFVRVSVSSLDLLDHRDTILLIDAVRTAFELQPAGRVGMHPLQRHLGTIVCSAALLYFSVHTRAGLHGFPVCPSSSSAVNIPAAKQKLY